MNHYARSFQAVQRRQATAFQTRAALLGAALGFTLHWALCWTPSTPATRPASTRAALFAAPADSAGLQGKRIAVLPWAAGRGHGEAAAALTSGLSALLASRGAEVVSGPRARTDAGLAAADLVLEVGQLDPGPSPAGQPRFQYEAGDSASARACLFLSVGISADLGLPLVRPSGEGSWRHRPDDVPRVRIELPAQRPSPAAPTENGPGFPGLAGSTAAAGHAAGAGPGTAAIDSLRPEVRAMVRALGCYFRSQPGRAPAHFADPSHPTVELATAQ